MGTKMASRTANRTDERENGSKPAKRADDDNKSSSWFGCCGSKNNNEKNAIIPAKGENDGKKSSCWDSIYEKFQTCMKYTLCAGGVYILYSCVAAGESEPRSSG